MTFEIQIYYIMGSKKQCSDDFIKEGLKEGEGRNFNEAIKCLEKTCFHGIRKWVKANRGNEEDAREVFQESIVRLLEKLVIKKIEFTGTVCAFLFGIARYVWLDELNRRDRLLKLKKDPSFGEKNVETEPIGGLVDTGDKEEIRFERFEREFKELSEICQGILLDFYINGLSMIEIAEKYGYKSPQVAKQRKFKCLKNLRKKV